MDSQDFNISGNVRVTGSYRKIYGKTWAFYWKLQRHSQKDEWKSLWETLVQIMYFISFGKSEGRRLDREHSILGNAMNSPSMNTWDSAL